MSEQVQTCKICGIGGLLSPHRGTVDCINQYRALVEDLRLQLPRGEQVMVSAIERGTSAQIWIDGEITVKGLDRLATLIRFMQEAWAEDENAERSKTLSDSDLSRPTTEAIGVVATPVRSGESIPPNGQATASP